MRANFVTTGARSEQAPAATVTHHAVTVTHTAVLAEAAAAATASASAAGAASRQGVSREDALVAQDRAFHQRQKRLSRECRLIADAAVTALAGEPEWYGLDGLTNHKFSRRELSLCGASLLLPRPDWFEVVWSDPKYRKSEEKWVHVHALGGYDDAMVREYIVDRRKEIRTQAEEILNDIKKKQGLATAEVVQEDDAAEAVSGHGPAAAHCQPQGQHGRHRKRGRSVAAVARTAPTPARAARSVKKQRRSNAASASVSARAAVSAASAEVGESVVDIAVRVAAACADEAQDQLALLVRAPSRAETVKLTAQADAIFDAAAAAAASAVPTAEDGAQKVSSACAALPPHRRSLSEFPPAPAGGTVIAGTAAAAAVWPAAVSARRRASNKPPQCQHSLP